MNLPPLEIYCDMCEGNGERECDEGPNRECEYCIGAGSVLTAEGQSVINLIQRYFNSAVAMKQHTVKANEPFPKPAPKPRKK